MASLEDYKHLLSKEALETALRCEKSRQLALIDFLAECEPFVPKGHIIFVTLYVNSESRVFEGRIDYYSEDLMDIHDYVYKLWDKGYYGHH